MFGHLKAEEFINLIEGIDLPIKRLAHLDGCTSCRSRLKSAGGMHTDLYVKESTIPEPDWEEFRTSVRTELLSRAIKRESAVWRWTGFPIRPVMAWGFGLALLITVSAGGFLLHMSADHSATGQSAIARTEGSPVVMDTPDAVVEVSMDSTAIESERAVWAARHLYETVGQLDGRQAEELRQLLETAPITAETGTPQ